MNLVKVASRAVSVALLVLTACVGPQAEAPRDPSTLDVRYPALPIVEATLDGRRVRALVDTGAAYSVVPGKWYGGLPDRTEVVVDICLGDRCYNAVNAITWDTVFTAGEDSISDILVGMRGVLDQQVVTFNRLQSVDLGKPPCDGETVRFGYDPYGRALGEARVNGEQLTMLYDTGSVNVVLDSNHVGMGHNVEDGVWCTVHGCSPNKAFTLQQVCVGNACVDHVSAAGPAWMGLGQSFFSKFAHVSFDWSNSTLHLCRE